METAERDSHFGGYVILNDFIFSNNKKKRFKVPKVMLYAIKKKLDLHNFFLLNVQTSKIIHLV